LTFASALYDVIDKGQGRRFMPCCAFAAFIVSQIVLGFGTIKRFLLRSGDNTDDAPNNPATEWRLIGDTPAPAGPPRRRFGVRAFALVASLEILLAAGAGYGYHVHFHHHHHHDLASVASAPVSIPVKK
jgi:hypothetical protein